MKIDEFVISLVIDSSGVKKAAEEAKEAINKAVQRTKNNADEIEKHNTRAANSFSAIARSAEALFSVFSAAKPIKDFFVGVNSSNAELQRFSANLGIAPEKVSNWEKAVERFGGSAKDADNAFAALNKGVQSFKDKSDKSFSSKFQRLGAQFDPKASLDDLMMRVSQAADKMKDKQLARKFVEDIFGDNEGIANAIMAGPAKLKQTLAETKKYALTAEDTNAAATLESDFVKLEQAASNLSQTFLTALTPQLVTLLRHFQEWIDKNQEWLKSQIVEQVEAFAKWIKSFDWEEIGKGIKNFAIIANSIAQTLGGWTSALELFFGLWVGAKFASVIGNVAKLGGMLGGLLGRLLGGIAAAPKAMGKAGFLGKVFQFLAALNFGDGGRIDPNEAAMAKIKPRLDSIMKNSNREREKVEDTRTLWQRHAPKWLGGKDAPVGDFIAPPNQENLPAGMRNNNPGNIKFTRTGAFQGVVGPSENRDQGDPQAVFDTPENGMQALMNLAQRKYQAGKLSLDQLIAGQGGWTPGNYQASANIAKYMGIDAGDDLNLNDPNRMAKFTRALMLQEHGQASRLYSDEMINQAAGVKALPEKVSQALDYANQLIQTSVSPSGVDPKQLFAQHANMLQWAHIAGVTNNSALSNSHDYSNSNNTNTNETHVSINGNFLKNSGVVDATNDYLSRLLETSQANFGMA